MNKVILSKEDQQAVNALLETKDVQETISNVQSDHSMSTEIRPQELVVATGGVDIAGLESIPMGMIALPYCRLVQPTTQHIVMKDGKEAPQGSFFMSDTSDAYEDLDFVLLRAKVSMRTFIDDKGVSKSVQQLSILGLTIDEDKLFILTLAPTSFYGFGQLLAQLKAARIQKSWQFVLNATSEKTENAKGKYYKAKFSIGEEIVGKKLIEIEEKALTYGLALDREQIVPEEE